jgi:hypothetical protein
MTHPEGIQQDAELDPELSTAEATADVNEGLSDKGMTAGYQTRLHEFDNVESVPVVSLPVTSSQLDENDFEVQPPAGRSG